MGIVSLFQPQMAQSDQLKVLETSHVSPPPGSVPSTSLRLAFFDLLWFPFSNIQRLFFYEFPYPTSDFIETILPLLRHSLSLTLQHFFPFAAKIMCPPPPGKPYIRYEDGDFVTFIVVESHTDFNHVIANYPRDVKVLHPFAPKLPIAPVAEDGTRLLPTTAFQVTVFPNAGICIGSNYCHVCGDGKTFMDFMRSWTSVYRAAGDPSCLEKSLPVLNKDVINDPDGIEIIESSLLKTYWNWLSSYGENSDPSHVADKVRATLVLGRAHVERLKRLVTAQCTKGAYTEQFHVSTFVVTCALIWVSLIKTQESVITNLPDEDNDKFYYFLFPFDCRNRQEFSIPETYFGNCIKPGLPEIKRSEAIGDNGFGLAAKAIGSKVKETEKSGLRGVEDWIPTIQERNRSGRLKSVAGSPKLRVYDIDFWGRPRKVELIHIESGEAISLAEYRDEEGGVEVGVALNKNQMDVFVDIFEQSLKLL